MYGKPSRHRYISADGRYIYNLAIIDYLQSYDIEKQGEHLYENCVKVTTLLQPSELYFTSGMYICLITIS